MKKIKRYISFVMLLALLLCAGCAGDRDAAYSVEFVDQNGKGVEGVTLQVCDDESCMLYTSDAEGRCSFELPGAEYELHILKLPEGYEADMDSFVTASAKGGEYSFQLTEK